MVIAAPFLDAIELLNSDTDVFDSCKLAGLVSIALEETVSLYSQRANVLVSQIRRLLRQLQAAMTLPKHNLNA